MHANAEKRRAPSKKGILSGELDVDNVLPLMREYISTYSVSDPPNVEQAPQARVGSDGATTPVPYFIPAARGRNASDPPTVLFSANLRPHPSRLLPRMEHPPAGSVPLRPVRSHSAKVSPVASTTGSNASQVHRFASMYQWTETYPLHGGALAVNQWAPLLLRDLNNEVDEDAPRPNPLRVSASMHVVEAAFHALNIPMSFFHDLESAVYVAHSGIGKRDGGGLPHPFFDVASNMLPVPRLFTFEAYQDSNVQRQVLSEKAVTALTKFDSMHHDLENYARRNREHQLHKHFVAWRCLVRVSQTYRRAATLQKESKRAATWKRVVFYSWKSYVSVARLESELEHLQLHQQQLKEKHQVDIANQASQFRKQLESERRVHDDALSEAKASQLTPEMRRQHEERLLQLKHAETQHKDDKKHLSTAEAKLKDLTVFKEQCSSVLRGTVDRLRQTIQSLLCRRQLDGIRAAAVIAVAYRLEAGSVSTVDDVVEVAARAASGLDVVQPPVSCSALSILLAWVNLVLVDSAKRAATSVGKGDAAFEFLLPLRAIGPELLDGVIYTTLWRVIDPDATAPMRVMSVHEPATRVRLFVSEFEDFLLDCAAEGISAPSADTSKRGAAGNSRSRSSIKHLRWSAMSLAGISAESLLSGDVSAHTYVLFLLMQLYHVHHLPNVTEQLDPAGFVVASLASRLPAYGSSAAPPVVSVESLEKLEVFAETLKDQCTTLHYAQRSVIAWRTVASHVESDLLGRLSLAATSGEGKSPIAALMFPQDKRLPYFTVRGLQLLSAMENGDAAHPPVDSEQSGSSPQWTDPDDPNAISASPTLMRATSRALAGGDGYESEEDTRTTIEHLAEVIPSLSKRQELFAAMERHAATVADVYCAHSGGSCRLRMPQCQRLMVECGVPVLEDVPGDAEGLSTNTITGSTAGLGTSESIADIEASPSGIGTLLPTTQQQVLDRYVFPVREGGSGNAFTPLSFMFMLAEVAVLVGNRSPSFLLDGGGAHSGSGQRVGASSSATPAKLFEAIVFQHFFFRVSRPIFSEGAYRGLHQIPHLLLSRKYRPVEPAVQTFVPSQPVAHLSLDAPVGSTLLALWDALPSILKNRSGGGGGGGGGGGVGGGTSVLAITADEFIKLWREFEVLVDSGGTSVTRLTTVDAKSIYQFFATGRAFASDETSTVGTKAPAAAAAQRGKAAAANPGATTLALSLRDFVDVLSMVAAFTHPSPLYSFYGRLKALLSERITPVVRRKYPTVNLPI